MGRTMDFFTARHFKIGFSFRNAFALAFLAGPAWAADNTAPGALTGVATFESIGVYAPFTGDDNGNNATVLHWRRVGETAWKNGMALTPDRRPTVPLDGSLTQTQPNPYVNQWRGSLLGLTPGVDYEARVTFSDPDGVAGANPATLRLKTRSDVIAPGRGRTLFVSPAGSDANPGTLEAPFQTLAKAAAVLQAGDTVNLRAGTYAPAAVNTKSGAADNWITVQSYQNEPVTIDGGGAGDLLFLNNVHYMRVKALRFANGARGLVINNNATNITVEDCHFEQLPSLVRAGAFNTSGTIGNITLQRNTFYIDRPITSQAAVAFFRGGAGNVIRQNVLIDRTGIPRGSAYWDGIGGGPDAHVEGFMRDSDIHGNYIEGCNDDPIQAEGNDSNVRIWGNTIARGGNGYAGIAVAPVVIGPLYIFRNVLHDPIAGAIKQGRASTGHQYHIHNVYYLTGQDVYGQSNPGLSNVVSRNNVVRSGRYLLEYTDNPAGAGLNFDYDALFTSDPSRFIKWQNTTANTGTFAKFQTFTGNETHGLNQDLGAAFSNVGTGDFTPRTGSPLIDKGQLLPGFNGPDTPWPVNGVAPDIGAFEIGVAAPPAPPTNLTAAPSGASAVLRWTDNSGDETGFKIERRSATGVYLPAGTAAAGATSFTDAALSPGAIHYYRLRAINAAGASIVSNETAITLGGGAAPPASPKNLRRR